MLIRAHIATLHENTSPAVIFGRKNYSGGSGEDKAGKAAQCTANPRQATAAFKNHIGKSRQILYTTIIAT